MHILVLFGILIYLLNSKDRQVDKEDERIRRIFREEMKSYHNKGKGN